MNPDNFPCNGEGRIINIRPHTTIAFFTDDNNPHNLLEAKSNWKPRRHSKVKIPPSNPLSVSLIFKQPGCYYFVSTIGADIGVVRLQVNVELDSCDDETCALEPSACCPQPESRAFSSYSSSALHQSCSKTPMVGSGEFPSELRRSVSQSTFNPSCSRSSARTAFSNSKPWEQPRGQWSEYGSKCSRRAESSASSHSNE